MLQPACMFLTKKLDLLWAYGQVRDIRWKWTSII